MEENIIGISYNIEICSLYLYHRSVTVLFKGERIFFGAAGKPKHAKFQVGLIPRTYFVSFKNSIHIRLCIKKQITVVGSL